MSTDTVLRCDYIDPDTDEVCGEELEYGGRGRPPTKCDKHKKPTGKKPGESKVSDQKPRARPGGRPGSENGGGEVKRQRPGQSSESETKTRPRPGRPGAEPDEKKSPEKRENTLAKEDTGSRAKAEAAHKRTQNQVEHSESEGWPMGSNGRPMTKISMQASELVPTGNYANISIGPATITTFIDLDRVVEGKSFFTDDEREALAKALNELAEVVEADVIAVQRALVMESMSDQKGN